MKLWEALKLLDEGKKVRRKVWSKGDYLCRKDGVIKRYIGKTFVLELDNLTYEDWEEYDDREELPEQLQWLKDANKFFASDKECIHFNCDECFMLNKLSNGRRICSQLDECIRELSLIYKM